MVTNQQLRSLGQRSQLQRLQPKTPSNRPALYLGRQGRSHKIRLPNGEIKRVPQRNVITRGALILNSPVTLINGMLDALDGTHIQT